MTDEDCLLPDKYTSGGERRKWRIQVETKKLGVINIFTILSIMMITWVYPFVKAS